MKYKQIKSNAEILESLVVDVTCRILRSDEKDRNTVECVNTDIFISKACLDSINNMAEDFPAPVRKALLSNVLSAYLLKGIACKAEEIVRKFDEVSDVRNSESLV